MHPHHQPTGGTSVPSSPVIFRRSELTHPLATPVRDGTLEPLRQLVNLSEDDFRLVIGWVVAAYFTDIPHPILLVQGEQGTAKSNLIRCLLALIDPQPAEDRESPADKREWAIFARASWAFSFDNVTEIPDWLSNSLCKGVTGDAVLQRVLHSDEDIAVFSFRRVIAMTTIAIKHDLAGDLTDRMLLVEPEVIEHRRPEADIADARAAALPDALGAVLDLVVGVLAPAAGRAAAGPAADGRLRPGPGRARCGDRVGHPARLPGPGRRDGHGADRGQHLRPRAALARRHPQTQPRRRNRSSRGCGRGPPRSCWPRSEQICDRHGLPVRRAAQGRAGGRTQGPRDRPLAAQGRRRHPPRPDEQAAHVAAAARSPSPTCSPTRGKGLCLLF